MEYDMGAAVEEASKSSLTSCAMKFLWSLFFLSDTEMLSLCKMYALQLLQYQCRGKRVSCSTCVVGLAPCLEILKQLI